jgi:hypothetical protein
MSSCQHTSAICSLSDPLLLTHSLTVLSGRTGVATIQCAASAFRRKAAACHVTFTSAASARHTPVTVAVAALSSDDWLYDSAQACYKLRIMPRRISVGNESISRTYKNTSCVSEDRWQEYGPCAAGDHDHLPPICNCARSAYQVEVQAKANADDVSGTSSAAALNIQLYVPVVKA